jgi:outer membrane protein OmpA-like peptidoglycan-associated protein
MHFVVLWALLAACVTNVRSCAAGSGPTSSSVSSTQIQSAAPGSGGGIAQTLSQSASAIAENVSAALAQAVAPDPDSELVQGLGAGSGPGLRLVSVTQAAADPRRYLQCVPGPDGRSVPRYSIYLGYDAFFSRNSDQLKPSTANVSLRELLEVVAGAPQARFVITGHTDTTGSDEINIPLSRARAEAVASWLVSQGISRDRLEAVGAGSSVPLVRPAASFDAGGYMAGIEELSLDADLRERVNRRVEVAVDCPQGSNR